MFIKELFEKDIWLTETAWVDLSTIVTRIAVRWIVVDAEWKIALIYVHSKWGHTLPGGWAEGASILEAIEKELLEEIGARVKDISMLWVVREHSYHMPLINNSYIFSAKVDGALWDLHLTDDEIEDGHEVVWMSIDDAMSLLQKQLLDIDGASNRRGVFVTQRDLVALQEYKNSIATSVDAWKIKELEEIAKKAQYDYIMLKSEFDSFVRRVEWESKEGKVQQLVELSKKLLPIVDQLWQSVSHIPADLEDNTWAKWVTLTYENAVKTLWSMGISQIPTIWHEPDMELHEPLSVEQVEDEALKGKIIKEFQPGYLYEKDGIKKVISAAKVIVGA
jgi:8-oxo-dGTP diphosphatase